MRKRIQRACVQVCRTPVYTMSPRMKRRVRMMYIGLIALAIVGAVVIVTVAEIQLRRIEDAMKREAAPPFPVSVIPNQKRIVENPDVNTYFVVHISSRTDRPTKLGWLGRIVDRIAQLGIYQQLASPIARVIVIYPGERKEEVAENIGNILDWNDTEREQFLSLVTQTLPGVGEGMYFPDRYLTHKDASPEEVAAMINEQFSKEVLTRYPEEVATQVSLAQALVIASLLEREAYDFTDMREISGIIWNRLFIDMGLQLDATLQYAKADGAGGVWWPAPVPDDKYFDSPFNTYENSGLPPAPISNPSLDAILAALNPIETDCLFYFHDSNSRFHCSETYEGHVQKLRDIYGQGR